MFIQVNFPNSKEAWKKRIPFVQWNSKLLLFSEDSKLTVRIREDTFCPFHGDLIFCKIVAVLLINVELSKAFGLVYEVASITTDLATKSDMVTELSTSKFANAHVQWHVVGALREEAVFIQTMVRR